MKLTLAERIALRLVPSLKLKLRDAPGYTVYLGDFHNGGGYSTSSGPARFRATGFGV